MIYHYDPPFQVSPFYDPPFQVSHYNCPPQRSRCKCECVVNETWGISPRGVIVQGSHCD